MIEVTSQWLLITAAIALLISLFEAWLATLIIYGKIGFLKKIFPATHNLIRSHVDYTIMTALLGFTYLALEHLHIELPKAIIVILCVGVLYNPFGFVLKAINPKAGNSDTVIGKIIVCAGFLPATIGFGYSMTAILQALI
jgi:hypothetical protein